MFFAFSELESEGYLFDDVRILGYSMGGLVARQMVCYGLPFNRLITVCSPHEGLLDHFPVPPLDFEGVLSIKKESTELKELNASSIDRKLRNKYVFLGHKYRCSYNNYLSEDDTVVSISSATGASLGNDHQQIENIWHYDDFGPLNPASSNTPHVVCLQERWTNDALACIIPYLK